MRFGLSKKADAVVEAAPAEPARPAAPVDPQAAKGRPTPKRRDAEGRRGPVPPPPTTRKEAFQRSRAQSADKRAQLAESARRGDDSALPNRDRGPVRRLVRDIVDTRRSVASLFLPFALIFLAGYFVPNPSVQRYLILLWTCFFLLVIVDSFTLGRRIKKLVRERFGAETRMRGTVFYGIQRSTMIRRWRFPKPAVGPTARI